MASISCIEVANFLCDGYEPGGDWIPMYRGVTLNLFGNPTALQIDNGGGKSSLTDACLYLLTRDRRLKPKVEDRTAPSEYGWTHIRLEFVERDDHDDILQQDFIKDPAESGPGTHYVIGLCWNRGKDPSFYRYRGKLSDAPCYRVVNDRLELIGNDAFKRSVETCERVIWNKWGNIQDWQREISDYTNIDIIRQNVEFQIEGAGDYSAMVTKVDMRNGQPYDVNFFRQFVAPELLRRPLGADSDADEYKFEDALFRTLKPTAVALMEISEREKELGAARAALEKLEPVERRAQEVVEAEGKLGNALERLAGNAALIDTLAHRDPLPGVPQWNDSRIWQGDKRLTCALSHLLLCRNNGVVITDVGLGELTGVSVGEINRRAAAKKILIDAIPLGHWLLERSEHAQSNADKDDEKVTQVLESKHHLKGSEGKSGISASFENDVQPIDFKHHIKESQQGKHRKHPTAGYDLAGALEAVDAVRALARNDMGDVLAMLPRAFGIGREADTNAYRREANRHTAEMSRLHEQIVTEEGTQNDLREQISNLQRGEQDLHECAAAFQTFKARANEFPEPLKDAPLEAEQWAQQELQVANASLAAHDVRAGQLEAPLTHYREVTAELKGMTLRDALATHTETYMAAQSQQDLTQRQLATEQANLDHRRREHVEATQTRQAIELQYRDLSSLYAHRAQFVEFFGDIDPDLVDPQTSLTNAGVKRRELEGQLAQARARQAKADGSRDHRLLYQTVFGDISPQDLDPVVDHAKIVNELRDHADLVAVEKPFVDALVAFHDAYPGITPADWVRDVERIKHARLAERVVLTDERERMDQELADLDAFSMADERVYSQALKLLAKSDVAFTRLKDIICAHSHSSRREQLLTLFSAALSAPVVDALDAAERATAILEQCKVTVPVFLTTPLLRFMEEGEISTSGEMAYTFLAGRRTRQVDVTLNPELLIEERNRAKARIAEIQARLSDIERELADYEATSTAMVTAVAAGQALTRKAVEKTRDAVAEVARLTPLREVAARRAAPDALVAIAAQIQFLADGGEDAYQNLVGHEIPELERDLALVSGEIERLTVQVGPDAGAALVAMRKFKRAGGVTQLNALSAALEEASAEITRILTEVDALATRIAEELLPDAEQARNELTAIEQTFELRRNRLQAALDFENGDGPAFMQGREAARQELVWAQTKYQGALQGIDFKRSARYIEQTHADERSFSERLAEAERHLAQSQEKQRNLGERRVSLQFRLDQIRPFSDLLHGLALMLLEQSSRMAILPDDLRTNAARLAPDPAILADTLALQTASLSDMPATTDAIRTVIDNIATAASSIDLDSTEIVTLQGSLRRAKREFSDERDRYCAMAQSGQIKGLQRDEIERIAQARTIADLSGLQDLKVVIARQIEREHEAVQKISEAMQSNKAATIDNLVQLARQAEVNLKILQDVMRRHPSACFKFDVQIASEEKISEIIELLVADIQDREVSRRARGTASASNSDIAEQDGEYRALIHQRIYKDIFIEPRVRFIHTAIRPQGETLFTEPGTKVSTGQHTALAMMWLVRHAEYAQARAVMTLGTKREQKIALKGSQRIMFFDGLFSNLTNESYIDAAFHGLRDVGQSFQLIGLIHNPHYVNNTDIFPIHLVGKKRREQNTGRERTFMTFKRWQADNGVVYFTSAFKQERPQ